MAEAAEGITGNAEHEGMQEVLLETRRTKQRESCEEVARYGTKLV